MGYSQETWRYVVREDRATPRSVVYQHRCFIQNVFRMFSGSSKFIQGVPTLQTTLITFPTGMLDTPSSERADSR